VESVQSPHDEPVIPKKQETPLLWLEIFTSDMVGNNMYQLVHSAKRDSSDLIEEVVT